MRKIQLTPGQRFGLLTVVEATQGPDNRGWWRCRCDCETEIVRRSTDLRLGRVKSCGCYRRKATGDARRKHAASETAEYRTWLAVKNRCFNQNQPSWKDYGGRGITLCDEWREDFATFLAYLGPRPSPKHSIDRIDVDGNYEPGNVRWATTSEQARNRRNNVWVKHNGRNVVFGDAVAQLGTSREAVYGRMKRNGHSTQEAFDLIATRRNQKPRGGANQQ